MNSDLLKVFLMIVDHGNLTNAARALCRTQSAVSTQLRKLEDQTGEKLFSRGAQGLKLNDHGKRLLPIARKVITELDEATTLFDEKKPHSIRVGFPDDFDETILRRILSDFSINFPDVEVIAHTGCAASYEQAISASELDVAVCSRTTNEFAQNIPNEENIWVTSKDCSLESEAVVPLALLNRNCWWCRLPTDALTSINRPWKVAYTGTSFSNFMAGLKAGCAVGVIPAKSCDDSLKKLDSSQGFPDLPSSKRSILVSKAASQELAESLKISILTASKECFLD